MQRIATMDNYTIDYDYEIDSDDYIVLTLYEQFKDWIYPDKNLLQGGIIRLVTLLIPSIQKIIKGEGRGTYKKNVLLAVLIRIVTDRDDISDKDKDIINDMIKNIIPITVDTMCGIAHRDIKLGKKNNEVENCCKLQ